MLIIRSTYLKTVLMVSGQIPSYLEAFGRNCLEDHTVTTKLPPPPKVAMRDENWQIWPRSVHFVDSGKLLVVSYLNHGVVCVIPSTALHSWSWYNEFVFRAWNVAEQAVTWHIRPPDVPWMYVSLIVLLVTNLLVFFTVTVEVLQSTSA